MGRVTSRMFAVRSAILLNSRTWQGSSTVFLDWANASRF